MKTLFLRSVFLCTLITLHMSTFVHASTVNSAQKYNVDLEKSGAKWTGKFMNADVSATLKLKSGQFVTQTGKLSSGNLVADMNSLSSSSGMDDQFKSALFLNTDKFPTTEFKIKSFSEVHPFAPGGPNAHITGVVTFKGEKHNVQSDIVVDKTAMGFHASGKFPTVYGQVLTGEIKYDVWAKK
jgi:polyisoprenoid-binding protein YceI